MKFRTFRNLAALGGCGVVLGTGWLVKSHLHTAEPEIVAPVVPPPPAPAPPPAEPAPVQPAPRLTTSQVRGILDEWLAAHADRQGETEWRDILPSAPFRATVLRFKQSDAIKWSNDSSQWSQIRLDLDRDGTDDEKWLLKNGHTYKRELLDSSGHTVGPPEYFSK